MKPDELKDLIRAVREEQEESSKSTPWMKLRSVLINWLMGALAATTAFVLVQWFKDSTEDADKAREFSKETKAAVEAFVKETKKNSSATLTKVEEMEQAFKILEEGSFAAMQDNSEKIKTFSARLDVFAALIAEQRAREISLGVEAPVSIESIDAAREDINQKQDAAVYRVQERLRD